jgi:hypothetical protein
MGHHAQNNPFFGGIIPYQTSKTKISKKYRKKIRLMSSFKELP